MLIAICHDLKTEARTLDVNAGNTRK